MDRAKLHKKKNILAKEKGAPAHSLREGVSWYVVSSLSHLGSLSLLLRLRTDCFWLWLLSEFISAQIDLLPVCVVSRPAALKLRKDMGEKAVR